MSNTHRYTNVAVSEKVTNVFTSMSFANFWSINFMQPLLSFSFYIKGDIILSPEFPYLRGGGFYTTTEGLLHFGKETLKLLASALIRSFLHKFLESIHEIIAPTMRFDNFLNISCIGIPTFIIRGVTKLMTTP